MSTPNDNLWKKIRRSFFLSPIDVGIERLIDYEKDQVIIEEDVDDNNVKRADDSRLSLFADSVHKILDQETASGTGTNSGCAFRDRLDS